jgi:long-subunit fatty acid transport protein
MLVALLSSFAGQALAQSTSAINGGIQFDFSLPGARSLAMGGAFVAVADDASASQSNPAGLTILSRPEVSIEGRFWNFFSLTPDSGHAFGNATGVGVDVTTGLQNRELKDSTRSPSFISVVWPVNGWAFAGYRQQFSKFENRIESRGPFLTLPDGNVDRANPVTGRIDLDIVNYGFSIARRVGSKVSIGGSLAYSDFALHSQSQSFLLVPHGTILTPAQRLAFRGPGQQFGEADLSDSNVFFQQQQDGDDTGWGATGGIIWDATERVRIGAAARRGAEFEYQSRFFGGPAHARVPSPLSGVLLDSDDGILFHVPDSYSGGVMFRPTDRLTISAEYDLVRYRQLLNGDGEGRPVDTAGQLTSPDPIARDEGRRNVEGLELDDSHQLRFGAEFFVPQPGLFLRVGTWFDPDHRLRFEDMSLPKSVINTPRGENEMHFSAGAGIDFRTFRVDGGFDLSPRLNTFSIAAVVYIR